MGICYALYFLMKPMRILIVPSWYPTAAKPVNGIFIREQADALSALHEVRVLFLDVLPRHTKRKPKHEVTQSRGYVEELIRSTEYPVCLAIRVSAIHGARPVAPASDLQP